MPATYPPRRAHGERMATARAGHDEDCELEARKGLECYCARRAYWRDPYEWPDELPDVPPMFSRQHEREPCQRHLEGRR